MQLAASATMPGIVCDCQALLRCTITLDVGVQTYMATCGWTLILTTTHVRYIP